MSRLRVVEPHAVDEHEHLAEVGAADGEVGLDAQHAAGAHVHRGHEPERIGNGVHRQRRICSRVRTATVRIALPSVTGVAAAVTTTVC